MKKHSYTTHGMPKGHGKMPKHSVKGKIPAHGSSAGKYEKPSGQTSKGHPTDKKNLHPSSWETNHSAKKRGKMSWIGTSDGAMRRPKTY